jgi:hypothetical protein
MAPISKSATVGADNISFRAHRGRDRATAAGPLTGQDAATACRVSPSHLLHPRQRVLPDDTNRFGPIVSAARFDHFMVAADFDATGRRSGRSTRSTPARLVARRDPQHRAHGMVSRIAPSANTRTRWGLDRCADVKEVMQALFIGQTYIDDVPCGPHATGRRKIRRVGICGVVRRQCGNGGVAARN